MNADLNPSTTVRHYSLVSEATEAEAAALARWNEAYARYEESDSQVNRTALIAASLDFKKAQREANSVRMTYKHNHLKRFSDGVS